MSKVIVSLVVGILLTAISLIFPPTRYEIVHMDPSKSEHMETLGYSIYMNFYQAEDPDDGIEVFSRVKSPTNPTKNSVIIRMHKKEGKKAYKFALQFWLLFELLPIVFITIITFFLIRHYDKKKKSIAEKIVREQEVKQP